MTGPSGIDPPAHIQDLNRLFRLMESVHVLAPLSRVAAHDPWHADLIATRHDKAPTALNETRVLSFGPLRLTVAVECSRRHRLPPEIMFRFADQLLERFSLPDLSICGSHSPLSPRLPHSRSDVDFVCFIPEDDFFSDVPAWCAVETDVKRYVSETPEFHQRVECGFLLQPLKMMPFMFDAAPVMGPDRDNWWDLDDDGVRDVLASRWDQFVDATERSDPPWRGVIERLTSALDPLETLQVSTQPRWADVAWGLQSPQWHRLASEYAGMSSPWSFASGAADAREPRK